MVQYFKDIYRPSAARWWACRSRSSTSDRKPVTLQYPDERQVMPDRFRGFVHNDMTKCDAVQHLREALPGRLHLHRDRGQGQGADMTRYAIDYNKCIWCSLCTENCHTGSITMSHDYDHSVYDRRSLVYEFMDPSEAQDSLPPRRPAIEHGLVGASPRKRSPSRRPSPRPRADRGARARGRRTRGRPRRAEPPMTKERTSDR